jgi:hypothetical protein
MTRHFYRTSLEGSRVVVTIGYDDRLFYMYIERLRPDRGEDDFIYHSGFAGSPKGFDDIKGVLASFGMKLPEEMAKEIRGDSAAGTHRKCVLHCDEDGVYERREIDGAVYFHECTERLFCR